MTYYDVFEWDFVKREGEIKHTVLSKGMALHFGKAIAGQFCEDEKPTFMDMRNGIWLWDTDCDFGGRIVEKYGCPRWKTLPNNDCSECPNADESCILVTGQWKV